MEGPGSPAASSWLAVPTGSLENCKCQAGWCLGEMHCKVQIPDLEKELGQTSLDQGPGDLEPFSGGSRPSISSTILPSHRI